jgi:dipeptidyl aminopeptidase/acylaminoacyl peptidase
MPYRLAAAGAVLAALAAALFALLTPPAPAGVAAGRPQVLIVHGGGWTKTGAGMVARMAPDQRRLRRLGYGTDNIDYRAGAFAYLDVLSAYDRLRERVGRDTPICVLGASAGGQMALMLAHDRPDVACVIAHAPPTLLRSLSPGLVRRAREAFDWLGGLDRFSPALQPFGKPLLLVQATRDPVVAISNSRAMQAAAPGSRLIELPPGEATFTHVTVDAGALAAAHRAEARFLARWASAD